MKIQAYMPVRDEADVLPHTLRHLHEQGCTAHVIDGWSTDGSWEIAQQYADSCERFPADGPDPIQNCTAILQRIEELAAASEASWILYTDADEWRRALGRDRLIHGVDVVDAMGFNAIDFQVYQFYCVDGSWETLSTSQWAKSGGSPEMHFRCYDQADCISRIPNRKLWKNVGRVCLGGGGHEVMFPGMKVCPIKFTMKHYPFRSPQQAKAKIETRRARRRMEEHAKGWGVHYDQYPADFGYCWDSQKLLYWKDTRSPLP